MVNLDDRFIIFIIIIATGYLARRFNLLKKEYATALANININIVLPSVVLHAFSSMEFNPVMLAAGLGALVLGLVPVAAVMFINRKSPKSDKGLNLLLVSGYNIGLFAIPTIGHIWGEKAVSWFAVFDLGNAFIIFGLSYIFAVHYSHNLISNNISNNLNSSNDNISNNLNSSNDNISNNLNSSNDNISNNINSNSSNVTDNPVSKDGGKCSGPSSLSAAYIFKTLVKSLPFMTYIVALLLNICEIKLPWFIKSTLAEITKANMPVSLLLVGMLLEFSFIKGQTMKLLKVLSIKYICGITAGIALYLLIPRNNPIGVLFLYAFIMPVPIAAISYSVKFGYDTRLAGSFANLSNIISFVLIYIYSKFAFFT